MLDAQGGGSTNGLVEYSYRLHASRLKMLIAAVKKPSSERKAALMEASRLLEHFWFDANHDTIFDDSEYQQSWKQKIITRFTRISVADPDPYLFKDHAWIGPFIKICQIFLCHFDSFQS